MNINQQKPFNPIIGETFQGFLNGNPVYLEQISHHPPISYYLVIILYFLIFSTIKNKLNKYIKNKFIINILKIVLWEELCSFWIFRNTSSTFCFFYQRISIGKK